MKREGTIKICNTSLNVWESPVDEKGMRQAFRTLLGCLRRRGYTVRQDPRMLKDFPSIASGHWLVNLGDLQATVDHTGRHIKIEYFQDLNVENSNGGRYDFSKYSRMDRRMQLRLIIEMGLTAVMGTQLFHHLFLGGGLCDVPTWSPPEVPARAAAVKSTSPV